MATNVVWSTLHLGNISDMDTNEGSSAIEDSSEILDTFGSPANPLWRNIVDVTTNSTNNSSISSDNSSTSDNLSYDLGAGTVTTEIDSLPLMAGTVTFRDGSTLNLTDLSVFQTTDGNVFLAIRDDQPALTAQGIESITFTGVTGSAYSALSQFTRDGLDFVCFAAGTRILTPEGDVAVETLAPGDQVVTLDHGVQTVRWHRISTQIFNWELDRDAAATAPVLIQKGALGADIPTRDLIVSPQHRVLVGGQQQLYPLFEFEALAPAKSLVSLRRIRHMLGKRDIEWVHFACDRHEIVRANGSWSESLLLGQMTLSTLDAFERQVVREIFQPSLRTDAPWNGPPARPLLSVGMVRGHLQAPSRETLAARYTASRRTRSRPEVSNRRHPRAAGGGGSREARSMRPPTRH